MLWSGGLSCPLCHASATKPLLAESLGERYRHCTHCDFRFLIPDHYLSAEAEAAEYRAHQNDLNDPGYRTFLQPLAEAVTARVSRGARGLDFGAGPGPLLAKMLEDAGHPMAIYDPLFFPRAEALADTYDFITVSEVAEHFHHPRAEFARLRARLKPGGLLAVYTLLYRPEIDFRNWHYRRERTHVGFFSRASFEWLAADAGFSRIEFQDDRTVLLHH